MNNGRMIEAPTTTPQTPARGHIAAQWRGSLAGCSARAAGEAMSALCQKRPNALQQKSAIRSHLVGSHE